MKPHIFLSVVLAFSCVTATAARQAEQTHDLACSIYFTDPAEVSHVPLSADWDIYYRSAKLNFCARLIRFVDANTGKVIPTKKRYVSEWPSVSLQKGGEAVYWGTVAFHPVRLPKPLTKVTIMMGKVPVTHFVTASAQIPQEGALLGEDPADLSVPMCPHTSHLTPDQVMSCTAHYWEWYYRFLSGLVDRPIAPALMKENQAVLQKRQVFMRDYSMKTLVHGLPHLFDAHQAKTGVSLSRVRYMTRDPLGQSLPVSGLLVMPIHPLMPASHLPLIMILHGYVSPETAPSAGNFSQVVLAVQLAAQGFSVFMPDYIGHGISQKQVEPFLIARSAYTVLKDGLSAVAKLFPVWNKHIAILGASQGAYTGMSFYRLSQQLKDKTPYFDDVFLAEGVYDNERFVREVFHFYMNPFWESMYTKYIGSSMDTWLRYFYAYLSTNEHYGYLPHGSLSHIYSSPSQLNRVFVRDFVNNHPGLPARLSAILTYASLINAQDRYHSPKTVMRLYGYLYDNLVAYGNTQDMLVALRVSTDYTPRIFGDLREGNCRVGSALERMSRRFAQLNPMILHSYCVLVSYDDFLATMGAHYFVDVHR